MCIFSLFSTRDKSGANVVLLIRVLLLLLLLLLLLPLLLLIIYLLIPPWSRVLLEKLTGSAASQEIPRFFGTRRFITVLTSARHLPLS